MKQKNIFILFIIVLFLYSCLEGTSSDISPVSEDAVYSITFKGTWNSTTHSTNFPSTAHFSPMVVMIHASSTSLFETGTQASKGIENMAETGNTNILEEEIKTKIQKNTAKKYFVGKTISSTGETNIPNVRISKTHSLVSFVSMIAPSPDWFVSIKNVALFENEAWVENKEIEVNAYDAGTELGNSFSLDNNIDENGKIHRIITPPLATNKVVPSMGKFIFIKK